MFWCTSERLRDCSSGGGGGGEGEGGVVARFVLCHHVINTSIGEAIYIGLRSRLLESRDGRLRSFSQFCSLVNTTQPTLLLHNAHVLNPFSHKLL